MSKFEFNGMSWDIDLLDMDTLEKYENGMDAVSEKVGAVDAEGKKGYELMREQLKAVDEFFDDFIGSGTAKKLFGDSNNLRPRLEAFAKASQLGDEMHAEIVEFQKAAMPAMNRAQRRASVKKKK